MNCIQLYQTGLDRTPVSKSLQKQKFFSTKRKRSSRVRMGKPTTEEKSKITSTLIQIVDIPEPELSMY